MKTSLNGTVHKQKKIQINIDDITLTENNIFQNISLSLSLVFSVLLPLILIKVSENLNKVAQNNKKKKKKVITKI